MSSKSKRPSRNPSPLGGHLDIAQQAIPDYVRQDAPCDVPDCPKLVGAARTITWEAENGEFLSILMRLCDEHGDSPFTELLKLLPALSDLSDTMGNNQAYIDHR
jgi:hypothetical protein